MNDLTQQSLMPMHSTDERILEVTLPHHDSSFKDIRTETQTGKGPRGRS